MYETLHKQADECISALQKLKKTLTARSESKLPSSGLYDEHAGETSAVLGKFLRSIIIENHRARVNNPPKPY